MMASEEERAAYYRRYIASPEWRWKRYEKIRSVGGRCERCRSAADLHVHHLSYKNFGNEPPEDLQVLCAFCHKILEHGTMKAGVVKFIDAVLRNSRRAAARNEAEKKSREAQP